MKPLQALAAALGVCLAAASLAGSPAAATPDPSAAVQSADVASPITVSVPLGTVDTPGKSGSNSIVRVQLGDSDRAIRLMVDTGIVGILLWGDTPRGARMTDREFNARISGSNVRGFVGEAPLQISGVTTTRDIQFAKISTNNSYIQRWKNLGVSGIIGLGTGSAQLTNPLMSLPGELARGWSLRFERKNLSGPSQFGALILGAQAPVDAKLHFTLPSAGVDRFGSEVWDDHAANGCWKFTGGVERCVDTWFDSGFTLMRVKGRAFANLPVTPAKRLRTGTTVELAAGSSAFYGYRVRAGNKGSRNLVRVIPRGKAVINTGNSIYFDYIVTYRVDSGDIYLSEKGRS